MKRSPLLPIFLIVVVDVLGLTIILPLLPFYAEHYGASPGVVGLLVATYALCQLVSGPVLGQLSDRSGRKPWLVVSQVGTLVGFGILAVAQSLWVVFLSRIIDGLTAGNLSLAQAHIADVTEPKDRARAFGVIGIAFGIGFLLGPALSGYLAAYNFRYPVYVAMALSATSIVATSVLLEGGRPGASADGAEGPALPAGRRLAVLDWGTYAGYFRRPALGGVLVQFFLFAFAFATFTGGFALFAERRFTAGGHPFGPRQVGYVMAYAGFLGIILQGGLIGRLVRRFGEERVVSAGQCSMAVGYTCLAFARHVPMLLGSATVSAFGNGALRPALTSLVTRRVDRTEQGVVLGLTQSLTSIASITAPPLAGWLIGRGQLALWALVAAVAGAAGLLVRRSPLPTSEPASPPA